MDTPIITNLKAHMASRGFSSRELALRSEVKPSFIYDILSGKSTNPSTLKLSRVAKTLGVDLSRLLEPDTPTGFDDSHAAEMLLHSAYIAIPELVVQFHPYTHLSSRSEHSLPVQFHRQWLGRLRAGLASQLRCVRIDDDSMAPTLHRGDCVLVDTAQRIPSPPGLFVLFDGFGLQVKRIEFVVTESSGRIHLRCDNPHYGSYETALSEQEIIGRVIWLGKAL